MFFEIQICQSVTQKASTCKSLFGISGVADKSVLVLDKEVIY